MALYHKYRPQNLTEVIGQAHIQRTFQNALAQNRLTHAYLFTGPRGTGKTSTARIIARAINCQNKEAAQKPCNKCEICLTALNNKLVDLLEIDAASNRGIDEIRALKEKIAFKPNQAFAKIYIIDEVHMLTKEAFNALLKTLEEPPAHAYFILATTEPHRVPATIISRCQRFDFRRITEQDITRRLQEIAAKEQITAEAAVFELIAKQVAGGMRDALGLLEQFGVNGKITLNEVTENLGLTKLTAITDFITSLKERKLNLALALIAQLIRDGANLTQFTKSVLAELRTQLLKAAQTKDHVETSYLLTIIATITKALENLKTAIIPQFPLEIATIEICGDQPNLENPPPASQKPNTSNPPQPPATTTQPAKTQSKETPPQTKIDLLALQKIWAKIIPQLTNPTLKLALKESTVAMEEHSILIKINSQILLEKINSAEYKNLLAEILTAETGQPLNLKFIYVDSSSNQNPSQTLAEVAAELF